MKKSKLFSRCIVMLSALFLLCSCASPGERAAKEVLDAAKRGDGEKTKALLIKYGETLKGQDLLDFGETLEEAGFF